MSLILEALKKSESRRRLGEAPDIGTPFTVKPRRRNPWPLIVISIAVAGGVGWWYAGTMSEPKDASTVVALPSPPASPPIGKIPANVRQSGAQGAKTGPAPTPRDSAAAQAPARTDGAAPGSIAKPALLRGDAAGSAAAASTADARVPRPISQHLPQAAPAPANPNAPAAPAAVVPPPTARATPPPVPVAAAPPTASSEPVAAVPPQQATPATAQPNSAPAKPTDGIQMAPTASAAPAVPQYYELAYSVRKDIPQFNQSMHVFSADPAARFIVVDGERKAEGDAVKEGLVLREVRTDGIVLEFRGQRFFYPRPGH